MSQDLLGPDGNPVGPKLSQDETEWPIGDQKLPPTPGTVEEWREFSITQPQLPMMVYIWVSVSRALAKQNDRFDALEKRIDELSGKIGDQEPAR
jgi:hypothetical protein